MKLKIVLLFALAACTLSVYAQEKSTVIKNQNTKSTITLSKEVLMDKIMGGWAGQTIGVTFGGPTEFRYNGTMMQDYIPIQWYDGYIKHTL
jgi:hypothetical protein